MQTNTIQNQTQVNKHTQYTRKKHNTKKNAMQHQTQCKQKHDTKTQLKQTHITNTTIQTTQRKHTMQTHIIQQQ